MRHPMIDRRDLLMGGMACATMAFLPQPAPAVVPASRQLDFRARRNGADIGWHRLRFAEQDDRLVVDIEIELEVRFLLFPVYSYRHTNREVWGGDRLLALESRTDDNGTRHRVAARAEGERLLVDGTAGRLELPPDTLPTSYWHEATVERGEWLDTQSGRLVRSTVIAQGPEPIRARGREVRAERYALSGDLECELWYHDGSWAKLRFAATDGSTIDYLLEPPDEMGG
jgi:Family of unknown function (DUF6134)